MRCSRRKYKQYQNIQKFLQLYFWRTKYVPSKNRSTWNIICKVNAESMQRHLLNYLFIYFVLSRGCLFSDQVVSFRQILIFSFADTSFSAPYKKGNEAKSKHLKRCCCSSFCVCLLSLKPFFTFFSQWVIWGNLVSFTTNSSWVTEQARTHKWTVSQPTFSGGLLNPRNWQKYQSHKLFLRNIWHFFNA